MADSDTDEENVIRYGTPLDPYEEDEIPSKRKYQQQPDQYAVDVHGRRRFHGAFTGGFSAGYGNTVGTPEGWTPATFKSSRSDKAQFSNQRPEDFMDEEDRSEFGIAPRQMQTQREFSGQKRPRQQRFHDGPIPGEPVLEQLVRAVHETAAVRMLRAMGWREGQGTGDRVTKQEKRKAKASHKVYGCYMPSENRQSLENQSDSDSGSEFEYDTLFAPDDYEPYILARKSDRFGLGYSGLSRHSVLGNLVGEYGNEDTSRSHLVMREKGKKISIRGQAFGVGAFEADDEDIYATEDMSHYDFAIGGATDHKNKKTKEKASNVLQGFVKSSKPFPSVPCYPAPALPRDYTPAAAGARRSRFEPTSKGQRDQGLGRHELTAEARGALLGETPVPKLPQIPQTTNRAPETTDPIEKIVGRNINFTTTEKSEDFISIKDSGSTNINVFKPFMNNPQKQLRYEKYLTDKDGYVQERDGVMDKVSEWERNREMMEFEQAAKLYRPLTGAMGDRFTHASQPDDALNPLSAVAKSGTDYGLVTPEQMDAAKRGVYGVMTRKEVSWRPEALVCKRFNVPEPGVVRTESKKDDKAKVSYSIFSYLESSVHDKDSFTKEQTKFSGSKSINTENVPKTTEESNKSDKIDNNEASTSDAGFNKRITVAQMFLKESEKDLKIREGVTETIEKFDKMDLYKSIFLSDSENEDEVKNSDQNTVDLFEKPKNVERNDSPPRGIFANINFDELNSWKRGTDKVDERIEPKNTVVEQEKEKTIDLEIEPEMYGPKVPDNLQKRIETEKSFKPVFRSKNERDNDSSSSDSWVDMKEAKDKKHKKKKSKKHKSKKKKSKHKKTER